MNLALIRNLVVEQFDQTPVFEHKIEIVERKGIGHPDTICDLISNQISINLCEEYLKKVGAIMHHNTDKALLVAGEAEMKFGGGRILKPMKLILGDRATFNIGNVDIPVNEIAISTAKKWLKENLRFVNVEKDIILQSELKRGSAALQDIFKRKSEVLGANDTSAAVGYAPFTHTEKIVYDLEKFLNTKDFKKQFPESGEDIKIMAFRSNSELNLTVSMAIVDRFIDSEDTYFKRKNEIMEAIKKFVNEKTSNQFSKINVYINTLDARGRGLDGLYLTVTGTCADSADCGEVGRGNRANGVISLNRPASEEAAAGKNPVSHVGKIYNTLSFRIADEVYKAVPGLKDVYVWLLSQIGRPINDPKVAAAQVVLQEGTNLSDVQREIREILDRELENINKFCLDLAKGKIPVC